MILRRGGAGVFGRFDRHERSLKSIQPRSAPSAAARATRLRRGPQPEPLGSSGPRLGQCSRRVRPASAPYDGDPLYEQDPWQSAFAQAGFRRGGMGAAGVSRQEHLGGFARDKFASHEERTHCLEKLCAQQSGAFESIGTWSLSPATGRRGEEEHGDWDEDDSRNDAAFIKFRARGAHKIADCTHSTLATDDGEEL